MTDEKKAVMEEWTVTQEEAEAEMYANKKHCSKCINVGDCVESAIEDRCKTYRESYADYLAGIKAGKPKWHKVADGDLPEPNIAVLICLQFEKWTTTYIAYYRPTIKKWQMYNLSEAQRQPIVDDYIDSEEVIAWCELPKYEEELNNGLNGNKG